MQARFIPPDYWPSDGKSLFPQWPVIDPIRAMWVFIGTMALLLVPKLLGVLTVMLDRDKRRGCGGVLGLIGSLLLETLIAGLMAPVVMLTQSIDVVAILLGRDSGWNAQRRDDGGIPFRDIVRLYRRHTILGVLLGVGAWAVSPYLALWMLPVVLGLALAVPLAALTGRRSLGLALRRIGLLRIPEEAHPPEVLRRAAALYQQAGPGSDAVAGLLRDPALLAAHRQMLPPVRRPGIDPLNVPLLTGSAKLAEADRLDRVWPALDPAEKTAVLSDTAALQRLLALASPPRVVCVAAAAARRLRRRRRSARRWEPPWRPRWGHSRPGSLCRPADFAGFKMPVRRRCAAQPSCHSRRRFARFLHSSMTWVRRSASSSAIAACPDAIPPMARRLRLEERDLRILDRNTKMSVDTVSGLSGSSSAPLGWPPAVTSSAAATQTLAASQTLAGSQPGATTQVAGVGAAAGVTTPSGIPKAPLPQPPQPFVLAPTEPLTPKVLAELIGRQLP